LVQRHYEACKGLPALFLCYLGLICFFRLPLKLQHESWAQWASLGAHTVSVGLHETCSDTAFGHSCRNTGFFVFFRLKPPSSFLPSFCHLVASNVDKCVVPESLAARVGISLFELHSLGILTVTFRTDVQVPHVETPHRIALRTGFAMAI
jgi:hypothetical protein